VYSFAAPRAFAACCRASERDFELGPDHRWQRYGCGSILWLSRHFTSFLKVATMTKSAVVTPVAEDAHVQTLS
jgi:hypothetical protein